MRHLCVLCGEISGQEGKVILSSGILHSYNEIFGCCERSWEIKRRFGIRYSVHAHASWEMKTMAKEKGEG